MNCKPGDLAIVVKAGKYAGRLVEVLYAAPTQPFVLPNGTPHLGSAPDSWVVNILGGPIDAPFGDTTKPVTQGATLDKYLCPLRGDIQQQGMPTNSSAPA